MRPGHILLLSKFYYNCSNNNQSSSINFSSFKLAMGRCSFFLFVYKALHLLHDCPPLGGVGDDGGEVVNGAGEDKNEFQ